MAAIREAVPAYRRPLEGAFGRGLERGVLYGLGQFVDLMERPGTRELSARRLYVDLGRGEAREGRTLESLLSAYRIGARLAWRKIAAEGREVGIDADTLALLAEGLFAYIDELSAASAEGWAEEQSAATGEAERRRAALATLLTQSPPAEAAAIEEAAREAGWALPAELAVLVWGGTRRMGEPDRRPVLPPDSISVAADDGTVVAVVPDAAAPARRAQLERALSGRLAALGPVTAWTDAWRSARRARAAFRLAAEGLLPGERLVTADRHLPELLLHADRGLLGELADHALAPLAHRSPAAQRRLADTLRALIDHQGRAPDAAAALHVHPQTVRYRLAQLREDFGDVLEDPKGRFELALRLARRRRGYSTSGWRACRCTAVIRRSRTSAGSSVSENRSMSSGEILPSASMRSRSQSTSPRPVVAAHQHDREVTHLAGLDQAERLEQLVERAEAAGEDDEAAGVADEHHLAREEVVELEAQLTYWFRPCSNGSSIPEPDRLRAGVAGAEVGRLHRARAAAGDHRHAGLADIRAVSRHERVLGAVARRARRAEERRRGADVRQRLEARRAARRSMRSRRSCVAEG